MFRIALLTTTLALGGCNAVFGARPEAEAPPMVVQAPVDIPTSSIPELDCRPAGPSGGITC